MLHKTMEDKVFDKELFSSLEWKANLIGVPDFDIEKLKHYLIESREKSFDSLDDCITLYRTFLAKIFIDLLKGLCSRIRCDKSVTTTNTMGYPICYTMPSDQIAYSDKYTDDQYEYRHVILPPDITKLVPKTHLMSETEWRNIGVQQSPGWIHYMVHSPEPHVLLFRRPLPKTANNIVQGQQSVAAH